MALLTANNLAMRYGPYNIFENINIAIHHGECAAIVGPNGQGKTTLLRILSGEEKPTAGQVFRAKTLKVGYLKQETLSEAGNGTLWQLADGAFTHLKTQARELADLEALLAQDHSLLEKYGHKQQAFELAGGYDYELKMAQVLTGLGFTPADYRRSLKQFSGGEQARAQLARLLLESPDLLLLDEPTNHLDLSAIEWLENYLGDWRGAVVVASHDRYFLDKVANRVFELSFDNLERYRGNYTHYARQRAERRARREKEYKAQQAFIAKEEEFIRRHLVGQRTKEAQGRRKRLERLKRDKLIEGQRHQKTMGLSLKADLRSGDLVLATHKLSIGYPDGETLLTVPDLEIRRGQCVALLGPNGSGKTTFLKTILKEVAPKSGKIRLGAAVETAYFAQIQSALNPQNTVLDEILFVKHNMTTGEARNHLGRFLFSGDDALKNVGDLSGGERNRLALAKFALNGANFLILDEPTNHLDIPAQEILEDVLAQFKGTILLVSHDRYFVDALASHVWVIEGDGIAVTKGNYSDYLSRSESNKKNGRPLTQKQSNLAHQQAKVEKRAKEKQMRLLKELEARIEATEANLAHLSTAIEEAGFANEVKELQKLGLEYQKTEETLAELLNRWVELEQ